MRVQSAARICVVIFAALLLHGFAAAQTSCWLSVGLRPDVMIRICTDELATTKLSKDDRYRNLLVRASAYNVAGEFDLGLADANSALEIKPDDVYALVARGAFYGNKEMAAESYADFEHALKLDPSNQYALVGLADAETMARQYDKAIADYTSAIVAHPNFLEAYGHRAVAEGRNGRCDLSMADEAQVLRRDPHNARAMLGTSYCYLWEGDADGALQGATQLLTIQPKNAEAVAIRGRAYLMMGEYAKALEEYTHVTELAPNDADGWTGRGNVFRAQREYDKAEAEYAHALEVKSDDSTALLGRAWLALDRGQAPAAVEDATRAVQSLTRLRHPEASALRVRAMAEFCMGQWAAAEKDYGEVAKAWPDESAPAVGLYLATMRGGGADGKQAGAALEAALAAMSNEWPKAAAAMFAGAKSPEELMTETKSPHAYREKELECDAEFYLGERALLRGDLKDAKKQLEKSVASGLHTNASYQMARAELERMKAK